MAQAKPRVLVAGTELAIETCRRILDDEVELLAARSVEEALERVDASVDLIISSVRFDESRMFDFLEALRARRPRCSAAVLCCRMVRRPLSATMYRSIETAALALGVKAFLDMDNEIRERGEAQAERRLRELVYAHLPREARVTT
jgi:response regulator RpfG family c-di-GMP phosphodiesterase